MYVFFLAQGKKFPSFRNILVVPKKCKFVWRIIVHMKCYCICNCVFGVFYRLNCYFKKSWIGLNSRSERCSFLLFWTLLYWWSLLMKKSYDWSVSGLKIFLNWFYVRLVLEKNGVCLFNLWKIVKEVIKSFVSFSLLIKMFMVMIYFVIIGIHMEFIWSICSKGISKSLFCSIVRVVMW